MHPVPHPGTPSAAQPRPNRPYRGCRRCRESSPLPLGLFRPIWQCLGRRTRSRWADHLSDDRTQARPKRHASAALMHRGGPVYRAVRPPQAAAHLCAEQRIPLGSCADSFIASHASRHRADRPGSAGSQAPVRGTHERPGVGVQAKVVQRLRNAGRALDDVARHVRNTVRRVAKGRCSTGRMISACDQSTCQDRYGDAEIPQVCPLGFGSASARHKSLGPPVAAHVVPLQDCRHPRPATRHRQAPRHVARALFVASGTSLQEVRRYEPGTHYESVRVRNSHSRPSVADS